MSAVYVHHSVTAEPRQWKALADMLRTAGAARLAERQGALYGIWRSQIGRPRDELAVITVWPGESDAAEAEALLLERVQFAGGLYAGGMTGVEHDLRADIRKLVGNSPAGRVVELIRSAPKKVRPLYLEWVKLLPDTERLQIEHAVSRS